MLAFTISLTCALLLNSTNARSQICDIGLLPGGGGTIVAQTTAQGGTNFQSDAELDIEIAPDLSSVRLENSKIRVIYSGFTKTHEEFAIREFVIKEANEDQLSGPDDFMAAGAGRGPLQSATLIVDEVNRKTVRLVWSRWSIADQAVIPSDTIVIDVTIFPNQAFLQFYNVDIQWHTTVTDSATPGGTTSGIHLAHGAGGWNRGYNTHDEVPFSGTYYDRYPPDGILDPVDGGSLNYNDHFVMAVFNPANGRGIGRVVPVPDTSIIKLLFSPNSRRGFETAHHPFYSPHDPFHSYLYAIESGSDPMAFGRSIADSGGVQPRIECDDTIQLTGSPYTDFHFSHWTGNLAGETTNPILVDVLGDPVFSATFDQDPGDYTNDFTGLNPGDDPIQWVDTESGNSLVTNDGLFEAFGLADGPAFGTTSTDTNVHSHYIGDAVLGGVGYEVSGRLKVTEADGGIGVTIFSQFPSSASYYRLRRVALGSFHLSPLGTSVSGETDTGIVPVPDVWYRFRLQAEDTGTRTELRAMVWKDGFGEPVDWQINVVDESASRLTGGSAGLWSLGSGAKYLDDVAIHVIEPPATDLVLTLNEVGAGFVTATPNLAEYVEGDVVTLEATGTGGEVFAGWSDDLSGFLNPSPITMLDDQTITATFIVPPPHSLTLATEGMGTINADPDGVEYLLGDVVGLSALPSPGWSFLSWSGALLGDQTPEALTITGDLQVTATFVEISLIEDFESVAPGSNAPDFIDTGDNNDLLEDDSLFSVVVLGSDQVLATTSNQANFHSHYIGAQLDGLNGYEFTGRMRLSDLDGGIGVTFFSQMPDSLVYYRLRRFVGTSFHLAPVGTGLSGIVDTGVTPLANVWYQFRIQVDAGSDSTDVRAKVWATGDAEPALWQAEAVDSSLTRPTSGTIGAWGLFAGSKYWDDFQVRPLAPPPPTLELDVSIVGSGFVSATPDQVLYSPGESVELEATADPGSLFVGWTGDAPSPDAINDITMIANTSLVASFAPIVPHPLTVTMTGLGVGSVSLSPDQPTYLTGEVVTLTATPALGSIFYSWGRDLDTSQNSTQITVFGPTSISARFVVPDYANDFQGVAIGESPVDWFDTGANNSLLETPGSYDIRSIDGELAFGTDSTELNKHSHWLGIGSDGLLDYRYTGRFRMDSPSSGIGLTVLSQFPNELAYYRIRRYAGSLSLHLAPVGTSMTSGMTDSFIIPTTNRWHLFVVEVEDTGTETVVRAKIWEDGTAEPAYFQIDAADASPTRLTAGTFGVWTMGPGSKAFDDLTIAVPEPSAVVVLSAGIALLSVLARRRNGARIRRTRFE